MFHRDTEDLSDSSESLGSPSSGVGYIGSKGISPDRFDEYLYSPSNCRLGVSPKCVSSGRNTRGVLKNTVTLL